MSGSGFVVNASAPASGTDSTFFYTTGTVPYQNPDKTRSDKTVKYLEDLLLYGGLALVVLYVIYGKK